MKWTPEELEAMRLADEEIDREFEEQYIADQTQRELDAWLDELAVMDLTDRKSYHRRRKRKQYSAAYYEAHKEEIAAKQAAYREAHKEEIAAYKAAYYEAHKEEIAAKQAAYREANRERYNAYMREYMREYKKGIRRKEKRIARNIAGLAAEL